MTPQAILRASLCRQPHCGEYSRRTREAEIDNLGYAPEYAEPGYTNPTRGIVFANWNLFPSKVCALLERAGWAIEWSDEWATCADCGRAVRTSPDSYGWLPAYRLLHECEIVCLDCLDPADYLTSIEDDPTQACPYEINPVDYGYTKYNGTFETGFHPGQTDDPTAILAHLQAGGRQGIVFRLRAAGQFDLAWEAYYRE